MSGEKEIVFNKRWKTKMYYIFIFLLLILIAALVFFKNNTKKELDKRIQAIRAAGYPVTLEELDQWYSFPYDSENAADIILNASEYYLLDQNDLNILPFVGSGEIKGRGEPLSEEIMSQSSRFLANNKKCLDLLYTAKNYKYCRYPIDLNSGYNTLLPHLNVISNSIRLLQLNAVYNSECNNPKSVIDSMEAMICIPRTLNMEPLIISQLSRSGLLGRVYKALEFVLNNIKFNEEELSRLQELLNESDEFSGLVRGIIGERCVTLDALKNILVYDWESMGIELPPVFVLEAYKALGLIDREARIYLDLEKEYLDILNLPLYERLKASKVLDSKINKIKKRSFVLVDGFINQSYVFIENDLRNTANLFNARTAIAIERYRLKNNELPDSVSNLVPDFLESVPLDPFDGKEIRYKKLATGYVVYCIGKDMIDNDGKEVSEGSRDSTYDITFIVEH